MKHIPERAKSILLCGFITTIMLFIVSAYHCYYTADFISANAFASYGLRMLVLFFYIAFADNLAKHILKRKENRE